MAKKKKRSGGGGAGSEQQQKPASDVAEERQEEKGGEDKDTTSGDVQAQLRAAATGTEDKDTSKENPKDKKEKEKEKEKKAVLPVATAVLKVDMHCDGCAKRIRASIRHYPGVEGVAMEVDKGTMTVVGRFDAKKLRDRVANKTKKKVELLANNNNNKKGGGGAAEDGGGNNKNNKGNDGDVNPGKDEEDGKEGQENKKKEEQDDQKKKGKDNKKPVVPVVGTVVLKIGAVGLHCDGCMNRIRTKLFHIQGVEQVVMDMAKNQVTVTGTMDIKALPEKLRKKLRRPVDVVLPGKQKDKDGKDKQDGKDGGKDAAAKALAAEKEAWKASFYDQQALLATEFILSDENPNACSIT